MVPLALFPPVTPFTCQVTLLLVELPTLAESWTVDPILTWPGPVTVTWTCWLVLLEVVPLEQPAAASRISKAMQ